MTEIKRRARANWATHRRLDHIDMVMTQRGCLRREDLTERFGISPPQASADLTAFQELYPDAIRYDRTAKCYVPASEPYTSVRGHADPNVKRAFTLLARSGHPLGWTA